MEDCDGLETMLNEGRERFSERDESGSWMIDKLAEFRVSSLFRLMSRDPFEMAHRHEECIMFAYQVLTAVLS